MGETTIPYVHYSFSPWWGCVKVSPGCAHCFADTFDHRLGFSHWGPQAPRRLFDAKHFLAPLRWNRRRERGAAEFRVLCGTMCDVFEAGPELDAQRALLFFTIESTRSLRWLLFTKRVENVREMVPPEWLERWPAHVWLIPSVEDQPRADVRIPAALRIAADTGARVGLSIEPLLGPIAARRYLMPDCPDCAGSGIERVNREHCVRCFGGACPSPGVDWVIVGGESGHAAREMDLDAFRSLREQCRAAGKSFYAKQDSGRYPAQQGRIPDELWVREYPRELAA
jgi:protein gp37